MYDGRTQPDGINVFGSFMLRAEPDYATVKFTVATVAKEPKSTLEKTGAATQRVRQVLAAANIGNADIQLARTKLELAYDGYGQTRTPLGYRASREFQILVRDLAGTEPLLVEIVAAGGESIQSIAYQTSKLKELRQQARQGAVAAAEQKAAMYAKAAGVGLGAVRRLDDVNPESLTHRGHGADVDVEGNSDDGAGVGSILISGAVRMSFAITAP